ncbi:MAG: AAA family ATPase, partial [Desulfohalobiaceae bacterium]
MQFFLQPGNYPHRPRQVELIETHASWVFLAGEYVFKVKKPVNFGFLDFSSLNKRRLYCAEEIRLNRRLAPDVYLGLWALLRDSHGNLRLGGLEHEEAVEYAVQMRRLNPEHMLDSLLQQGRVDKHLLDLLARRLVAFHLEACCSGEIAELGSPTVIRSNHTENFEQTRPFLDWTIPGAWYRFIKCYSYSFIKNHRQLLLQRKAQSRIREAHGDLRCEHVCIEPGDKILAFDCIEFNSRFRYIDVAAEIAFLAMDMELAGHGALAQELMISYAEQSQDPQLPQLSIFYKCYYAFTRGKVQSFHLQEMDPGQEGYQKLLHSARQSFEQSFSYACRLEKKTLILCCGLTGSGKSHLAQLLSPLLGAELLRSDVLRKELQGLSAQTPSPAEYGQGLYSPEITEQVYSRMLNQAEALLNQGRAVMLDATFLRQRPRLDARQLARDQNCSLFVIYCTCPERVIQDRMRRRQQEQ